MTRPYFRAFEDREPPARPALSPRREQAWQLLAGLTIGLGATYLHWRWTASLNPEAPVFSVIVALAETLAYLGALLFFHDIWREGDTPAALPPATRAEAGLDGEGPIGIDLFVTTYDEATSVVLPSLAAARGLRVPAGYRLQIWLLDDGNRPAMARLARHMGAGYLARRDNRGFKAGNLANALFRTSGDFFVICDADTRVLPALLQNCMGYFRDPAVAWVQTPHWFYDIPEGESWAAALTRSFGRAGRLLAPVAAFLGGGPMRGRDPFLSDPGLFFDVIQRRRNRNDASFCCGAGSIHRREAVLGAALRQHAQDGRRAAALLRPRSAWTALSPLRRPWSRRRPPTPALPGRLAMQPFRFHVSEDLLTSVQLHGEAGQGWKSVYHPGIECRMLSPWSLDAVMVQRLKYAGGTFDILLRHAPLFRRGMSLPARLHYAATFWSYLSVLWAPVLLFAPAVALVTGLSPVAAHSGEYFLRLLPPLIAGELAMILACKGHDFHLGRAMALTLLPVHARALWSVLRGQRPRFPPTPKTPVLSPGLRHVMPNLAIIAVLLAAICVGLTGLALGRPGHDAPLVVANCFWAVWSIWAVARILPAVVWRPEPALAAAPARPLSPALTGVPT